MPGRHGFSQFYDAGDIYADLAAALTIRGRVSGAPRKIAIPVRAGRTGRTGRKSVEKRYNRLITGARVSLRVR